MTKAHTERVAEKLSAEVRGIDGMENCGLQLREFSLLFEAECLGDLGILLLQASDARADVEFTAKELLFGHIVEVIGDGLLVEGEAGAVLLELKGEDGIFEGAEAELVVEEVFIEAAGVKDGAAKNGKVSSVDVGEGESGGILDVVEGKLRSARIDVADKGGDGDLLVPKEKPLRAGMAGIEYFSVALQHARAGEDVIVDEEDAVEGSGGDAGVASLGRATVGGR